MFEIRNNFIKITKGDSASIKVNLTNDDGSDYVMQQGEKLRMTVRKAIDKEVLFSVESASNILDLTPTETKKLIKGSCFYDIQLETLAGDVFTVAGITDNMNANMFVLGEITE